jgi:hypothetical protein
LLNLLRLSILAEKRNILILLAFPRFIQQSPADEKTALGQTRFGQRVTGRVWTGAEGRWTMHATTPRGNNTLLNPDIGDSRLLAMAGWA